MNARGETSFGRLGTSGRFSVAILAASWVLFRAPSARADVRECIDDHSQGQLLRDESKFVQAREHFVHCAMPACPDAIRSECDELLEDLERRMPTLVLAAQDARGADVTGARVFLDGQPVEGALNGRAIAVDPGAHELRFVAPDGREELLEVVVREWVQGRTLAVRFDLPASAAPEAALADPPRAEVGALAEARGALDPGADSESSGSGREVLGYVLGGVGVAALGGFGYFAVSGRSLKNDLRDSCAPTCTESQASSVRSKYLVADILLGTGLALLGTGTYLLVSRPESEAPASE